MPVVQNHGPGLGASRAAVEPQILNGVVFDDGSIQVPSTVAAGGTLSVSGTVGFDCPQCAITGGRQVRVIAQPSWTSDRTDNVGTLDGLGQTGTFSFQIPAPEAPDQAVSLTLVGQRRNSFGDWVTDNTTGPFDINTQTQTEQTVTDAIAFAPWAVGGGAVGLGAARFTGRGDVPGAVAGAGAGIVTKVLVDQQQGNLLPSPDFPTLEVAVLAAALGAGALFLSTSGIGDVGQAIGGTARTAIDEARGQLG